MLQKSLITLIDSSLSLSKINKREIYEYLQKNPEKTDQVENILKNENLKNQKILHNL